MAALASELPSSTARTSKLRSLCASTESRHSASHGSASRTGSAIERRGAAEFTVVPNSGRFPGERRSTSRESFPGRSSVNVPAYRHNRRPLHRSDRGAKGRSMTQKRRKFWGWGYEDEGPSADHQKAIGALLGSRFGFEVGEPAAEPRIEEIELPRPRIAAPSSLAPIASVDPYDR